MSPTFPVYWFGITPTSRLEVGKGVGMVGEVEGDMDLRMTVVGEIVVVEGPKVLGEVGVG